MRAATASELADYLERQIPIYGSISTAEAQRILLLGTRRGTLRGKGFTAASLPP